MTDTIVRLHPFDGLFFRARHLDLLQDYVRALSADSAIAGGSGTVHGLDVTVDGTDLVAAPGLAVTGEGRLLASTRDVRIPLPAAPANGVAAWLLEAVADEVEGEPDELTYSRVPGATDGGRRSSTTIERLGLRVSPVAVPPGVPAAKVRSALAAARFAAERPGPGLPDGRPAAAPGAATAVPLAIVFWVGGWVVDVWAARRDRGQALPERAGQLALGLPAAATAEAGLRQFQAQLGAGPVASPLAGLGFVELPPAGFLPMPAGDRRPADLREIFGGGTGIRVFACDEATARARVQGARRRDRIPLTGPVTVDVLVPGTWSAGGAVTSATPWVAFARPEVVVPEPAPVRYELDLFAVQTKPVDYADAIADAKVHAGPADQLVTTLRGTTVPGLDAYRTVAARIDGANRMTLLVVAATDEELPVAGQRAARVLSGFGGVAATADRLPGVAIAGLARPAIRIITEQP
ncbi:hypothetical protein [Actinoplanes sp. HUAS TT8]|uniref:hypothetical protein n=1 Tax=Actinoplanes sp. HUAS TT8 TaxID=3447453 RepID=UPI003F5273C7